MQQDWITWSTEHLPRVYRRMSAGEPFLYANAIADELKRHRLNVLPPFESGFIFLLGVAYGKHVERLRRHTGKRRLHPRRTT